MSITSILDSITKFLNGPIISKILGYSYWIFIVAMIGIMLTFVWYLTKQGTYEYVMNRYKYKIKIIVRDDALFIYYTPFWMYPKLINYNRIRSLGVAMAKTKAPKIYKKLKRVYTVNTLNLTIYKEADMNT